MSNPTSFREAANKGLLLGVQWTLAVALPILIVVFLLGDYWRVRADAAYAAQVIRASLAEQQKQAQQPPPVRAVPGPAQPDAAPAK